MTSPVFGSFIDFWKARDFSDWNESDVREDFIAPLLRLLGYSKNSVNDIVREASYGLPKLYHRVGRDKIQIDYIPTLRLERFWLIEAKGGKQRALEPGDLFQAYLYAIHPSVQTPFIVLTNGWEIRVYDASQIAQEGDDRPIEDRFLVRSSMEDCDTTFGSVYKILGAKTMLASINNHAIDLLRRSLWAEIDERMPDELRDRLTVVIEGCRQKIQSNARNVQKRAWFGYFEQEKRALESYSFDQLLILLNMSQYAALKYGEHAAIRVINADVAKRAAMVERVYQFSTGRPRTVFLTHALILLARIVIERAEVPGLADGRTPATMLEEIASGNMSYWSSDGIRNALVHLDNTSLRVSMKFGRRLAMTPLQKQLEERCSQLPAEEILTDLIGLTGNIMAVVETLASEMWDRYYSQDAPGIWRGVWAIQGLETALEHLPDHEFPEGEGDLRHFEYYGRGLDMLSLGTRNYLEWKRADLVAAGAPQRVLEIANMDHEYVRTHMPVPSPVPADFDPLSEMWVAQLVGMIENRTP